MKLRCVSPYTSALGTFVVGQVFDVADRIGGEICRSSPESFEEVRPEPPKPPEPTPQETAMSTETATGIVAPDRRARGGKLRRKIRS